MDLITVGVIVFLVLSFIQAFFVVLLWVMDSTHSRTELSSRNIILLSSFWYGADEPAARMIGKLVLCNPGMCLSVRVLQLSDASGDILHLLCLWRSSTNSDGNILDYGGDSHFSIFLLVLHVAVPLGTVVSRT